MRYLVTLECVLSCNAVRREWNSFIYSFLYVFMNEYKREHRIVLDKDGQILQLYKSKVNDYDGAFMQWVSRMSDLNRFERFDSDSSISRDKDIVTFSGRLPITHCLVVYDIPLFVQNNGLESDSKSLNMIDIDQAKAEVNKGSASQTINITTHGKSKVKIHDINTGNTSKADSQEGKSSVLNIVKKIVAFVVKIFGS